jgi:DNA sulfur modification protein DndC
MKARQQSLFPRMGFDEAISLSLASLCEYGWRYPHWAVAYSGGKDSSATVTFVAWAIKERLVPAPKTLTVLYADTRMEMPPLQQTAMGLLVALRDDGFDARVVLPPVDDRFFVYMLGRGVPAPKNRFRWCTPQIKVEPMARALLDLRERSGQKLLMLTGVRLGESAARDQRIAVSCSKDSGECGQGWFQTATDSAVADVLAPLLHWRICFVYDWLYYDPRRHGYKVVADIATVYGEEDVRTGCVGCNLIERDEAIERLCREPVWSHLAPLLELKPLYRELMKPQWRKRKVVPERIAGGKKYSKNGQRMGPLTMEARAHGLDFVLDVQRRAGVDLVNVEEEARIREMWALDVWPEKWSADDADADCLMDRITVLPGGDSLVVQPLLL